MRASCLQTKLIPILCGSALKNKGVQPMLDAVIDYLPSPLEVPSVHGVKPGTEETEERIADDKQPMAALAFKVAMFEGRKTVFVRVYSGASERAKATRCFIPPDSSCT